MVSESGGERIARLEERMKAQEAKMASIEMKLWGAMVLIVGSVASKILAMLQFGGGP